MKDGNGTHRNKPLVAEPDRTAVVLQALHKQRARSDRSGTPFTLLLFEPPLKGRRGSDLRRLARAVARRIRETDEAAWFGAESIGAILHDCTPAGAEQFMMDVRKRLPRRLEPVCRVYPYQPAPYSGNGKHAPSSPRADVAPSQLQGLRATTPTPYTSRGRRVVDSLLAAALLLLLLPLLLLIALAVKCASPGTILLRQWRVGPAGRRFATYRFRNGTKLGHILRSTRLDRLPMLWNVLRGELSLTAPGRVPLRDDADAPERRRSGDKVVPRRASLWATGPDDVIDESADILDRPIMP